MTFKPSLLAGGLAASVLALAAAAPVHASGLCYAGAMFEPPNAMDDTFSVGLSQPYPIVDSDSIPVTAQVSSTFPLDDAAGNGRGRFAHVFKTAENDGDIRARFYDENNAVIGDEQLVSTQADGEQSEPSIAGLANGGYVIVWRDEMPRDDDPYNSSIRARIYDADGNPTIAAFRVNTITPGYQIDPQIAVLADGRFVVVWTDASTLGPDPDGYGVHGQIYAADGTPEGDQFLVNTATFSWQYQPHIAALTTGGFAIVWKDYATELAQFGAIRGQVFDAAGQRVGIEFPIHETSTRVQNHEPEISAQPGGGFAVLWTQGYLFQSYTGPSHILQRFSGPSQPVGDPLTVLTDGYAPAEMTGLDNGELLFAYSTYSIAGCSHSQGRGIGRIATDNTITGVDGYSGGSVPVDVFAFPGSGWGSIRPYGTTNVRLGISRPADTPILTDRLTAVRPLGNDTDGDNDPLNITAIAGIAVTDGDSVTLPDGNVITLSGDALVFDGRPSALSTALAHGEAGMSVFTYDISDGSAGASAAVTLNYAGVNNPPIVMDDEVLLYEDIHVSIIEDEIAANDSDPDNGDFASLRFLSGRNLVSTAFGRLRNFNGTGPLSFESFGAYEYLAAGEEAITPTAYFARDQYGAYSNEGIITLRIQGANDAPVAGDVEARVDHDAPVDLTALILAAVTDVDTSDTHLVTAVDGTGLSGSLSLADGNVTYDPRPAFGGLSGSETGRDSFGFTIADPSGATSSARMSLRVLTDMPPIITVATRGVAGSYFGQIVSGGGEFDCRGDNYSRHEDTCSDVFDFGSTVTLTANVLSTYQSPEFLRWNSGPCDGQGATCTFTVDGPEEIFADFVYTSTPAPVIRTAILPGARSGYVGGPPITALMSVVIQNDLLQSCRLLPPDGLPGTFTYQLLDQGNQPVGEPNAVFDINIHQTQGFVFAIEPTAVTGSAGYTYFPRFDCYAGEFSPVEGVNSLFLAVDAAPAPDILSIGVTPSGDGMITISEPGGVSFMSAAAMNIGAGDGSGAAQDAVITVSVDTGSANLPLNLGVCETDTSGTCISERAASITRTIGAGPSLFAVFVRNDPAQSIPVAPATSRVFLRFVDQNGIERSSTSAAVVAP